MAIIPKAEFEARFTPEEIANFRASENLAVVGWLELFDWAETIDTDYEGTYFVLSWAVTEGLISEERIAEVML